MHVRGKRPFMGHTIQATLHVHCTSALAGGWVGAGVGAAFEGGYVHASVGVHVYMGNDLDR